MTSRLTTAIDILSWLERDESLLFDDRIKRDRALGLNIESTDRAQRVLLWWQMVKPGTQQKTALGARVVALRRLATAALVVAGLVTGGTIAGVAMSYQGQHPVNLFALLGILVGIPGILMVLSIILLAGGWALPAAITEGLAILNPGRWVGALLEKQGGIGLFETLTAQSNSRRFARWQMMAFSQAFAIGYFVGVLVIAWSLVIFTDLAFGWSTTLNIQASFVSELMHALAWPWASWLPSAVPDASLVENSRFFRLDRLDSEIASGRAAQLGGWWPFILMTILVWGLMPRLLLMGVANWQLKRAVDQLLENGPGIAALLDRMGAPLVTFDGDTDSSAPMTPVPQTRVGFQDVKNSQFLVWNGAVNKDELDHLLGNSVSQPVFVAEWQPTSERSEAVQKLKTDSNVAIVAKGWEPPLLAFIDFLDFIRSHAGQQLDIVVIPLATSKDGISKADRDTWARAIAKRDDPRTYVASATL